MSSQMPEQTSTDSGHLSNFVGGAYVGSRDGKSSTLIDPSTGQGYLEAPVSGAEDIDLDFGCVWINTHIPIVAETPHGGFKQSGYGKRISRPTDSRTTPGSNRS